MRAIAATMAAVSLCGVLAVPCALAQAPAASAPPAPAPQDEATVAGVAAGQAQGRIAINQAAGSGNAQVNLGAMASADGGLAVASVHAHKRTQRGTRERDAVTRIHDGALSGSAGLLSVNQTAGSGNAQANLFLAGQGVSGPQMSGEGPLGFAATGLQGISGIDDAALAAVAGDATTTEGAAAPSWRREAVIADDAFRGSQGVVQVNQAAGVGNTATNAIVLQLPGGTP